MVGRELMDWRAQGIFLAGTAVALPPPYLIASAVEAGDYDDALAERTGLRAVRVAGTQRPRDLATDAGRAALDAAGIPPAEIDVMFFGVVANSGLDMHNGAAEIQRKIGVGRRALVASVNSGCDSGLVALEMVASHLAGRPQAHAGLVVCADTYPPELMNRWETPEGVFGDAGAAVAMARSGPLQVISTCTVSEPELARLHQGDDQDGPVAVHPVSLRSRMQAFMRDRPLEEVVRLRDEGALAAVRGALADSGSDDIGQMRWVVLPFLGRQQTEREYLNVLGVGVERTTWRLGDDIGHTGPSDPIIALHRLRTGHHLNAGDRILAISAGAGMIWTAAVVEAIEPPAR
jgi:3-oxoacyl-[acyl-carrier-protein] synthase III